MSETRERQPASSESGRGEAAGGAPPDGRPRRLSRRGFLVLGAAETVVGLTEAFKPLSDRRGLYAPNKDALKSGQFAVPKIAPIRPLAAVGTR